MDHAEIEPSGWRVPPALASPAPFPVYRVAHREGPMSLDGFAFAGDRLEHVGVAHGLRWTRSGWFGVRTYAPEYSPGRSSLAEGLIVNALDAEEADQRRYRADVGEATLPHTTVLHLDGVGVDIQVVSRRSVAGTALISPTGSIVVITWTGPWTVSYGELISSTDIADAVASAPAELLRRAELFIRPET